MIAGLLPATLFNETGQRRAAGGADADVKGKSADRVVNRLRHIHTHTARDAFFHIAYVVQQVGCRLTLGDRRIGFHARGMADAVGPDVGAALVGGQLATFEVGDQAQSPFGGMQLAKLRQSSGQRQNGDGAAAFKEWVHRISPV